MNRTTILTTAAAGLAAVVGAAIVLPGAASATDFVPRGTCAGAAILHQTKGVAKTLHTWTYTVNGLALGVNPTLEGVVVGGHPAVVTVVGKYWRAANADITSTPDAGTTIVRTVDYPTNCQTPPPPATTTTIPATTTSQPNETVCDVNPPLCQPDDSTPPPDETGTTVTVPALPRTL